MWSWLKRNWRTIATVGCSVVAAGTLPIAAPVAVGIGAGCSVLAALADKKAASK